jgi:pimeloyl-ACP methyl ester carboxylesterase
MPDSSALWLLSTDGGNGRYVSKEEGYEAWISPQDLQPRPWRRRHRTALTTPFTHRPARRGKKDGERPPLPTESTMTKHEIHLSIDGTDVRLYCISRTRRVLPLVFLHGFGSTKEDYADIAQNPDFAGQPFFAYDAPGCGESWSSDLEKVSIPFLVNTALAALADQGIERFHLVGHSMGGLTSLMLAYQEPGRVATS